MVAYSMSDLCLHSGLLTETGLAASLFTAGLVGGFTHCAGMCGPFVLAQATQRDAGPGILGKLRAAALIPYHLGRGTTYVAMAVLFSGILSLVLLEAPVRAVFSALALAMAGLIFLTSAIPALAAVFPWLAGLRLPLPVGVFDRLSRPFLNSPSVWHRYVLGVLLGFMPCGMVVAAILAAATAGTPLKAAMVMGAFVAGTIPALFLTAAGGQALKALCPALVPRLSAVLIVLSGLSLFYFAGTLIL